MKKLLLAAFVALTLAAAAPALAADPTPFGGATVANGVAKLVSDTSNAATSDDFSGVRLPLPTGLTLAQVTQLATEFNVTDDDCGGGSPRFVISYGTNENITVNLGPSPNFTGCAQNTWLSTGNLVGTSDRLRVDTSQVGGGVDSTWAQALSLVGSRTISSISLVVDGSWKMTDKEQTVLVRNVKLNGATYFVPSTPTTGRVNAAKACKAQKAALGTAAFNELWGANANSNGIGKCVSATAKARNAARQQTSILNAAKTCKARGLKRAALGRCVAATDRVAATLTEAQEHKAAKAKAKGKG